MFPPYYRDGLYLQLLATIFESSLILAVKSDLTATPSEEKKKTITSVVADNIDFSSVSAELFVAITGNKNDYLL